jgi:DNA-binding winged helix-turn-helix (wHTH) protein/tetratricopeptide (TPR) repeat protein
MDSSSHRQNVLRTFGPFTFDPDCGELARNGSRIRLQPQPALVLILLTDQPGKLIPREEIYRAVWGENTHVDFEQSLNYCIRQIRSALRDEADHPTYLETVPKRGYRFLCPVAFEASTGDRSIADEINTSQSEPSDEPVATKPRLAATYRNRALVGFVACGGLLVLALFTILWRSHRLRAASLHPSDTVVLADFANSTGDAVFDDALKTALNVSLRQSPFLKVLPDSQIAATLQQMTRPTDAKLTPQLARELCQRAGNEVYIAGSIGILGSEYVLELKAVNCQNGDVLAQEQVTVVSKENVLNALGETASKLRGELGESLATVHKFDVPLEQATTSSLEALKAYSLGIKAFRAEGPAASVPYHQHAIQLDPNFALGYWALGDDYGSLGEVERAGDYFTKAFRLREHASEREKLAIAATYYLIVTGELNKAVETYQEEVKSYPQEAEGYGHLGVAFCEQGQYEKGAEVARQALRLAPDDLGWHSNLANYALSLQHFDEARRVVEEAQAQKLDGFLLHNALYALAFLGADSPAMAEQAKWFAGKPEENFGLELASDTEAYSGHLRKARELSGRAVDSAMLADSKESGAIWLAIAAQREAAYGYVKQAQESASKALKLAPTSEGAESEAAMALALAGDAVRAESLAQDLGRRFPLDTQMQSFWLPAIRMQLALRRNDPASALNFPEAAAPIELGQIQFTVNTSCLYLAYVRGEAYLAAGQGAAAVAEFQKILDHSGIVWNCWTGALAHLGVARANASEFRTSKGNEADAARIRALAAYKDFLILWKDADSGIPVLKQAQAEYAKLQRIK